MRQWEASHIAGSNGPALFVKGAEPNIRLANFVEATEADMQLAAAAPELAQLCDDLAAALDSVMHAARDFRSANPYAYRKRITAAEDAIARYNELTGSNLTGYPKP